MVGLTELWLPVLLSAVAVFVASSIIHVALSYHDSDYQAVPEEEKILAAMRTAGCRPGNYYFPHPGTRAGAGVWPTPRGCRWGWCAWWGECS